MKKSALWIASFVCVLLIFHICYDIKILIPTNISWLMTARHDWGTHYLGFYFYKGEPWHFPLGNIENYFYPIGTNVGFTDSIPLLAMFFKLFGSLLPENFQYFGIWLLSCHLLTAFFTIKLFGLFKINSLYTFLAVLFIASNPVLIYRGLHPALCAHWLFIAPVYLYFLPVSTFTQAKKILLFQFVLLAISALVNPYICLMVLGFTFIISIKFAFFENVVNKKNFFVYLVSSLLSLVLVWYIVGFINFNSKEDLNVGNAYGLYSLNLNSLFNSTGFSALLPALKQVSWHQYEGFMYLGVGMMLLITVVIFYALYVFIIKNKFRYRLSLLIENNKRIIPLLIFLILLILFSITNIVSINDKILFKIPLPEPIKKFGEVFRASARFFWIPYYLIFFFVIISISRIHINDLAKYGILAVALFIQFYDTKSLMTYRNLSFGNYVSPLDNKSWISLMNQFDDIVFFPPFESHQLTQMDYQDFCFLAASQRKPINIGYVARLNSKAIKIYSDSLIKMLEEGKLSPRTLYITTAPYLNRFSLVLQSSTAQINSLDGYYYIFSKNINNPKMFALSKQLNEKNKKKLDSALNGVAKRKFFREIKKIEPKNKETIIFYIQRLNVGATYLSIDGFAFEKSTQNNKGDSVFVTLTSSEKSYITNAKLQSRPDITTYFKRNYLEDAGFVSLCFFGELPAAKYQLGLAIKKANGDFLYEPTEQIIRVGIPEYALPQKVQYLPLPGNIIYGLDDNIKVDSDSVELSGWAAYENQEAENCIIKLFLKSDVSIYVFETDTKKRPDVTAAFKKQYNLDNSGFSVKLLKSSLPKGNYKIGFLIKDTARKKEKIKFTDKEIEIK
jgi:hypothetical protein